MERSDPDFERLVAHYRSHVDAYVRRRIHHDAADDVVAETFATAWRRRDELPGDGLPWLYARPATSWAPATAATPAGRCSPTV